jgi:hypothetical protein
MKRANLGAGLAVVLVVLSTLWVAHAPALAQSSLALQMARTLVAAHPASYYQQAAKLFQAGQRDDAVFVFYLGQLRYRTHLAARRAELKPDGDPALFASLSEVVGRPINEYAFGDIPALVKTLDAVFAFDAANPDGFTPRARFAAAHASTRSGLKSMQQQITAQADSIRAERKRNGLANRN